MYVTSAVLSSPMNLFWDCFSGEKTERERDRDRAIDMEFAIGGEEERNNSNERERKGGSFVVVERRERFEGKVMVIE